MSKNTSSAVSIALAADMLEMFATYHIHPQEAWTAMEIVQDRIKQTVNTLPESVQKECLFLSPSSERKIGFAK